MVSIFSATDSVLGEMRETIGEENQNGCGRTESRLKTEDTEAAGKLFKRRH